MTDEAWPRGWHLSLSWFWLVWHHGAVHWSMVHGEEFLLVLCLYIVHQQSCCPSRYVRVCIRGSFEPQRALLMFLKLPKVTSRPLHMDKHLAEQQLSEVGNDLCWHSLPKSHIHAHTDELCGLCQDWKEASWYFGSGCSGLPLVVCWLFL